MIRRWANGLRRLAGAIGTAPILLLALLALGHARPESEWVLDLRGQGQIESELQQAQTRGYYENLLDAPQGWGRAENSKSGDETPPHGSVVFADSGLAEPDPGYRRWRIKPGLDVAWNGRRFRTNRLGHRSPEIEPTKPPGTYRIVVLGSSNTMGHGVDDEAIYLRHLERWLNDRVAGQGPRVEVVNLSVSGDAPSQRLLRLREDVQGLDPDWIVCDATVMDVSLEEIHLEEVVRRGTSIPFAYVEAELRRAAVSRDDPPEQLRAKLRGAYRGLLEGAYAGWAAESRRLGVPLTVVLLPRADSDSESPRLRSLIRSLTGRYDLDFVDLSGAFASLSVEEFRVAPWDKHPSDIGHRAIFEHLRDELLRRGGCPGLRFTPSLEGR